MRTVLTNELAVPQEHTSEPRGSSPIQAFRPVTAPHLKQAQGRRSVWSQKILRHMFERRWLYVPWLVVCVQSGSRLRLGRQGHARKPITPSYGQLVILASCALEGEGRCSPGAGLRSALKLLRSSDSCFGSMTS